jgi:hypothetical protein
MPKGLRAHWRYEGDKRGKASGKNFLTWSLVDHGVASHKPRPKVVAAVALHPSRLSSLSRSPATSRGETAR